MSYPADLKYTASHEWVRTEGDLVVIGVSWFAQDSMGDVVHVELPEVGDSVDAGETACEIESVKAVSDVYSPVTGEVVEINEALEDQPELVNVLSGDLREQLAHFLRLARRGDVGGEADALLPALKGTIARMSGSLAYDARAKLRDGDFASSGEARLMDVGFAASAATVETHIC